MGTNDVVGGFNHPLQSLPFLSHAQTMIDCDVSSHKVFYCSSIETDQSLALKFSLLEFPQKVEPLKSRAFLTRVMCDGYDRFSVMLISRKVKLLTCSLSAPPI